MAKQRIVNTKFWSDPFVQGLEPDEKLLYLYLLTNERTSICGIYEITKLTMSFDTGIPIARLDQIVTKLSQAGKIKIYGNWIKITNFIKNQKINPSIAVGIERAKKELPEDILDRLGTDCIQAGYSLDQLELEPELEPEPEKSPKGDSREREEKKEKDFQLPDSAVQVNEMLVFLAGECKVAEFADIKKKARRYAWNLVQKAQKMGEGEFMRRWWKFKREQDLTKFKYIETIYGLFKTVL